MGYNKQLKNQKPPSYSTEFAFVSTNLLFLKFYNDLTYQALGFFGVLLPMMAYSIVTLFAYLLKFVQLMQIEDQEDESQILTSKQRKVLSKIIRNLLFYFGFYFLSIQLDQFVKTENIEKNNMLTAIIAIDIAFLIQLYHNRQTRQAIEQANLKQSDLESGESKSGLLGATGLTTIFNALTQTTTTLCANGQCFTIYSNTIASNLAAFGVSVTAINSYLVPLCCLLLTYSVWCLYKERRDVFYKPFLLGLTGALLIVFDNFLFGESLDLQNIPSWAGNVCLIVGTIWAGRDTSKEKANPFGV